MSSKPSPAGVHEFKILWDAMAKNAERAAQLRREINVSTVELTAVTESYGNAFRDLFKLMDAMDIKSDGNFGYENRMGWFLGELHRQVYGDQQSGS